jgi:hypothetical protein
MSSHSNLPRFFTWLFVASALCGAVWLGSSLTHGPTRKHPFMTAQPAAPGPDQASPVPIRRQTEPETTDSRARAAENGAPNVPANVTNDTFLDQHYANQVVADVKPLKPADTPAQFEQKVRAMDPEYAQLLDDNAAQERRAALQNAAAANAPLPRLGTDDER